jgi:hypothetical protein
MDIKKLVNKPNTREWVRANGSTNSKLYREEFVNKYGGQFVKNGKSWLWEEIVDEKPQPNKLWLFTKTDGISYMVENFMEFCRLHELSKSAMYELMNGKRKSHKGFIKVEKLI